MKLEQFETEYRKEVDTIKSVQFTTVVPREFKIPSYRTLNTKVLSFAFALPALVFLFGIFINTGDTGVQYKNEIAMLEDSNSRLINEINNLDYEGN